MSDRKDEEIKFIPTKGEVRVDDSNAYKSTITEFTASWDRNSLKFGTKERKKSSKLDVFYLDEESVESIPTQSNQQETSETFQYDDYLASEEDKSLTDTSKVEKEEEEKKPAPYKYTPLSESEKLNRDLKYKRNPFDYGFSAKTRIKEEQYPESIDPLKNRKTTVNELSTITEYLHSDKLLQAIDELKDYLSETQKESVLNKKLKEALDFIEEKIILNESEIIKEDLLELQNKFGDILLNIANTNIIDFEGVAFERTFDIFTKINEQIIKDNEQLSQDDLIGKEEPLENESEDIFPDDLSELTIDPFLRQRSEIHSKKKDIEWIPDNYSEKSSAKSNPEADYYADSDMDTASYPDPKIGYSSDDDSTEIVLLPDDESEIGNPEHQSTEEISEQKEIKENGVAVSESQDLPDSNESDISVDSKRILDEQPKIEGKEKRRFFTLPKAIRRFLPPKKSSSYTKIEDSLGHEVTSVTSKISEDDMNPNIAEDDNISFDVREVAPEPPYVLDKAHEDTDSFTLDVDLHLQELEKLLEAPDQGTINRQSESEEVVTEFDEERLDEELKSLQQVLDESLTFEQKLKKFTVTQLSSKLQKLGEKAESVYLDLVDNTNAINESTTPESKRVEHTLKMNKNVTELEKISTKTGLLRAEYDRRKSMKSVTPKKQPKGKNNRLQL